MTRRPLRWTLALALVAFTQASCSSCSEDLEANLSTPPRPDSGVMTDGGGDGGDATMDQGGDDAMMPDDAQMTMCGEKGPCEPGQICRQGACALASCEDLSCTEEERCELNEAGGAVCLNNRCAESSQCPEARFCAADGTCQQDLCQADAASCQGGELSVCAADGSGVGAPLRCPLACEESAPNEARCVCRDDWECPTFMRCEAGLCLGSGRAAQCALEPVAFEEARPSLEMSWGTKITPQWPSPYPKYSNVAMTTFVANLDDDNADGEINEFDFPEIVFVGGLISEPFNQGIPSRRGVLRVLRGGGPNKGETMMALCDDDVWRPGDDLEAVQDCDRTVGDHYRIFGSLAIADLNGDGTPEITAMMGEREDVFVRVLSNRGEVLLDTAPIDLISDDFGAAISVADIDADGMAEVLLGAMMIKLNYDAASDSWSERERFVPKTADGSGQEVLQIACVGDLSPEHEGLEWTDQMALWRVPKQPADRADRDACDGSESGEDRAWCERELVTVWDKRGEIFSQGSTTRSWRGACAIADVWGAQGPASTPQDLDGSPEVVWVAEEEVLVLDGRSGELLSRVDLNPLMGGASRMTSNGGAPNIDDFDGDGLPEVGAAFSRRYVVVDFQPTTDACEPWVADERGELTEACTPGSCGEARFCDRSGASPVCRCTHNSWARGTEDDSSRRTGSSVFDFNGDGAAEVVYNDECFFRIYDGRDGETLFEQSSEHITNIEYPVIADVDNDGNAEIIFSSTSQGIRCSIRDEEDPDTGRPYRESYNTGVQVWGDRNDAWVSARRIWNQHAYAVTQIYEDGGVPIEPQPHWQTTTQGLLYNTYRSNPRSEGVAPDLVIEDLRLSSPQMGCGALTTTITITGRVENRGDLRVGPGVVVVVQGTWEGGRQKVLRDGAGEPLAFTLTQSLEPLRGVRFELTYDALADGESEAPESIQVEVDPDPALLVTLGLDGQSERECREDNNVTEALVGQEALADLVLVSLVVDDSACPKLGAGVVVRNEGSSPVAGVEVRFFAGDPDVGGSLLGVAESAQTLNPGEEVTITTEIDLEEIDRLGFLIRVHAVVTPLGGEDECNLSNNVAAQDDEAFCPEG